MVVAKKVALVSPVYAKPFPKENAAYYFHSLRGYLSFDWSATGMGKPFWKNDLHPRHIGAHCDRLVSQIARWGSHSALCDRYRVVTSRAKTRELVRYTAKFQVYQVFILSIVYSWDYVKKKLLVITPIVLISKHIAKHSPRYNALYRN